MRRALPGGYRIHCRNRSGSVASPATVQVGLFTNWGRKDQEVKWQTLLVDEELVEVGRLDFEFGEDPAE